MKTLLKSLHSNPLVTEDRATEYAWHAYEGLKTSLRNDN
jgi:hypothetical protein